MEKQNILVNSGIAHLHKYTQTHKHLAVDLIDLSIMLCSTFDRQMALFNAYRY